jgi:hypothetical protein
MKAQEVKQLCLNDLVLIHSRDLDLKAKPEWIRGRYQRIRDGHIVIVIGRRVWRVGTPKHNALRQAAKREM